MKLFVGIGSYRLNLSECASLKDKRRLLKSLRDRIGTSRLMGISEYDDHELWKSSTLGITSVSPSFTVAKESLLNARRMIESSGVEVVQMEQWILNCEDLRELPGCHEE